MGGGGGGAGKGRKCAAKLQETRSFLKGGAVLNPYRCGLTFLGGGEGVSRVRVFGDPSTWLNAIAVTLAFRQLKG